MRSCRALLVLLLAGRGRLRARAGRGGAARRRSGTARRAVRPAAAGADDLNRQGSAPFAQRATGRAVIVYYNATLRFVGGYDPSDWDGLSPPLIASALGATDRGIFGLGAGPMTPGSSCVRTARSSTSATATAGGRALPWRRPTAGSSWRPAERPRADELIQRLAKWSTRGPGCTTRTTDRGGRARSRAAEHPAAARQRATRVVVATGPAGGEYARFLSSVTARLGIGSVAATRKAASPTRSWWTAARRASRWCRATSRRRPSRGRGVRCGRSAAAPARGGEPVPRAGARRGAAGWGDAR